MDRQKHIAALAENQEDQLLLSQIWDRFSSGVRRNIPTATAFLSGREQILAERLVTRAHLGEPASPVLNEKSCAMCRTTMSPRNIS